MTHTLAEDVARLEALSREEHGDLLEKELPNFKDKLDGDTEFVQKLNDECDKAAHLFEVRRKTPGDNVRNELAYWIFMDHLNSVEFGTDAFNESIRRLSEVLSAENREFLHLRRIQTEVRFS